MLWLLLATYVLGALFPRMGIAMRGVSAGAVHFPGGATANASLPALMLGILLAVAGLGSDLHQLKRISRAPGLAIVGLVANTMWPIMFAVSAATALRMWSNNAEAESLLVGLAIAGAMPIAGASATWAQNADGNVALSLALVLVSTLTSPLLTPLVLDAVAGVTTGDYSEDLSELARGGATAFVVLAVVLPSLFGLGLRGLLGEARVSRALPALKVLSLADLLLLNYSNAALTLPEVVRVPDWNFLALSLAVTTSMCGGGFVLGWWIASRLRAERGDRISLTFALGMTNNGSGLVLAATALWDHPLVLLPIMLYNVVQQIGAGIVNAIVRHHPSGLGGSRAIARSRYVP